MATNDFKPFATGAGANVTPQADWEGLPALLSGFTSGKASSAQVNKAIRQASFIAAALAQFVTEKTDSDVHDDGDLAGFVSKLTAGLAAQYLSRSNPFGDIKSDGETAVSTALQNLGLAGTAVFGQNGYIPLSPVMVAGNLKNPILQWNRVNTNSTGTVIANLPIPYPNGLLFGFAAESQPTGWGANTATSWGFDSVNSNATQVAAYVRNIQPGSVAPSTAAGIIITLGW